MIMKKFRQLKLPNSPEKPPEQKKPKQEKFLSVLKNQLEALPREVLEALIERARLKKSVSPNKETRPPVDEENPFDDWIFSLLVDLEIPLEQFISLSEEILEQKPEHKLFDTGRDKIIKEKIETAERQGLSIEAGY